MLQSLSDKPMAIGAGRANRGSMQRRSWINRGVNAVAAVAVDANGGNNQPRFPEAMSVDAHHVRFRGLRVTFAADLDKGLQACRGARFLA